MSFIKINLTNVKEPTAAPSGNYGLTITDKEEKTKEDGSFNIRLRISFTDHKEYRGMNHFLNFPGPADDEEKAENKKRFIARFLRVAGVEYNEEGFDTEALMGANFYADVIQDEPNEKGDIYNSIVLPPVPAK